MTWILKSTQTHLLPVFVFPLQTVGSCLGSVINQPLSWSYWKAWKVGSHHFAARITFAVPFTETPDFTVAAHCGATKAAVNSSDREEKTQGFLRRLVLCLFMQIVQKCTASVCCCFFYSAAAFAPQQSLRWLHKNELVADQRACLPRAPFTQRLSHNTWRGL